MGLILRRILSFLTALAAMAAFYAFAVLVEGGDARRGGEFTVRDDPSPVTPAEEFTSGDARSLTRAFGASMPVPGSPLRGTVTQGGYHGYMTREIAMQGAAGSVRGIRPSSAAAGIMPKDAVFLASGEALLGFPALRAENVGQVMYALVTNDAAFLIIPNTPQGGLNGFAPDDL